MDTQAAIQKAIEAQNRAIDPAIQSYRAQLPEIQAKYNQQRTQIGAEKGNLQNRYKALIGDMNRRQGTEEVGQQTYTTGEMAKRGITPSSGMAQQNIQNTLAPIRDKYNTQLAQTNTEQESALQKLQNSLEALTPQETAESRAIQNAIASMQANAGQSGISQALQQIQQDQQRALEERRIAAAQEQNNWERQFKEKTYSDNSRDRELDLQLKQAQLNKANQAAQPGGGINLGGLFGTQTKTPAVKAINPVKPAAPMIGPKQPVYGPKVPTMSSSYKSSGMS